jgi:spore coat polysaccharide biosynthesis predicted glycosyltransferase SpsG
LSPGPEIDFIVAGGARYGMGHVMRSSTLAAAAVQRGWRVRAFLAGDRVAQESWIAGCPDSEVLG